MKIRSWPQFAKKVRRNNDNLLKALPKLKNPIFVSGCQRSGGTMLASALTKRADIAEFGWSKDTELDGAQILAGVTPIPSRQVPEPRFCFQTTYLNEQVDEYTRHVGNFKLIWLIRNPHSVVYSMVHNWKRFALNELFLSCGAELLDDDRARRLNRFGVLAIRPIERACFSYLGKLAQATELLKTLPPAEITTVEYEFLVTHKACIMEQLINFVGLPPSKATGDEISKRSMNKASKLNTSERATVARLCEQAYEEFTTTSIRINANSL